LKTSFGERGLEGDWALSTALLRAGVYIAGSSLKLAHSRPWGAAKPGWTLVPTSRFDERIDTFFDDAASAFDFIGLRTMDYMNWRYGDIRAGDFRITTAEEGGRILGFSVLALSHGRAKIADLLALPGRLDVAASLLGDAIRYAHAARAASIDCWLPRRHPYRSLLRREGFLRTANRPHFFERIGGADEDVAFLDDPSAAIHFTLGDSDLV